ncbi:hypothetical protein FOPG_16136 [Fusarium oxysporum f. sp. conglutinans race 2 54008]|uniref:Uncharacterized protein n=2 Tax=Fusarium oxysporum TaxID=5507 RepID=W9I582_FUSOX|nr:hypothetical protein FOYG_09063 [Fusarium oxysporum NRRL 32931]EXL67747.1 hypothetical protein FOPG_16136 [Fusarium oxysporum f. sp. conglutinans race 2 54008]
MEILSGTPSAVKDWLCSVRCCEETKLYFSDTSFGLFSPKL